MWLRDGCGIHELYYGTLKHLIGVWSGISVFHKNFTDVWLWSSISQLLGYLGWNIWEEQGMYCFYKKAGEHLNWETRYSSIWKWINRYSKRKWWTQDKIKTILKIQNASFAILYTCPLYTRPSYKMCLGTIRNKSNSPQVRDRQQTNKWKIPVFRAVEVWRTMKCGRKKIVLELACKLLFYLRMKHAITYRICWTRVPNKQTNKEQLYRSTTSKTFKSSEGGVYLDFYRSN